MFQVKKCELYVTLKTLILIRNVKLDSCNPAEFGLNFCDFSVTVLSLLL